MKIKEFLKEYDDRCYCRLSDEQRFFFEYQKDFDNFVRQLMDFDVKFNPYKDKTMWKIDVYLTEGAALRDKVVP